MAGRDDAPSPSPQDQVRALYEDAESRAAKAFEQAVGTPSFGGLLARVAENAAALSRVSTDLADLALRNLRVAGRSDIVRLARQLHRTEDKLERVLQEVEMLRDELRDERSTRRSGAEAGARANGADAAPGRTPRAR